MVAEEKGRRRRMSMISNGGNGCCSVLKCGILI
jgi:hypothetical protein